MSGIGSPPPMRGKGSDGHSLSLDSRITPAYAGKSQIYVVLPTAAQDHPRLCGEKSLTFSQKSDNFRITPAYAGKS